jgi:hypothetical protein
MLTEDVVSSLPMLRYLIVLPGNVEFGGDLLYFAILSLRLLLLAFFFLCLFRCSLVMVIILDLQSRIFLLRLPLEACGCWPRGLRQSSA